jgi:hypothetical protein
MSSEPETSIFYWGTVWVKVKTDVFIGFWSNPNEQEIERSIDGLLLKFGFEKDDTLNNSAHKMLTLYERLVEHQKDFGSVMVLTPFWLFDKIKKRVEGINGVGRQIVLNIEKMIDEIVDDPEKNLPKMHDLSYEEIEDIKGKSSSSLSEKVMMTVLMELARRGQECKLELVFRSHDDFQPVVSKKNRKEEARGGNTVMANNITMNTAGVSQGRGGAGRGAGGRGGRGGGGGASSNYDLLCGVCGLFCKTNKTDTCKILNNGQVSIQNLLMMPLAIYKPESGAAWTVHTAMQEKMSKYLYLKLNLDMEQKKKLYEELVKGVKVLYDRHKSGNNSNTTSMANNVTADQKKIADQAKEIKRLKVEAEKKKKEQEEEDEEEEDEEAD